MKQLQCDEQLIDLSTPDYDMSIHQNPDASAWAKLFKEKYPDSDEGLMLGWFANANAMMAMHDYLIGGGPICGDQMEYMMKDKDNV